MSRHTVIVRCLEKGSLYLSVGELVTYEVDYLQFAYMCIEIDFKFFFLGLRKVYPYYFIFKTYVKGRWLGKTVLDVYKAEFKQDGINPVRLYVSSFLLLR